MDRISSSAPEVKLYDPVQAADALRVSEARHLSGKLVLKALLGARHDGESTGK
jgi:hypothetical protein